MPTLNWKLFRSRRLAFTGIALVIAAGLLSNPGLEHAFGREPHSLTWGPALFRILLAFHGFALMVAAIAAIAATRTVHPERNRGGRAVALTPRAILVLGVLTALALLLRIPSLDSSLWLDEVLTMVHFARPPITEILTSFPDQNQHMLYSLLAHISMQIFGEHAWALRLPSVLLGVGSIWTLFLLGRRLIGETEALLACALMTVSYHHIWFSQNARGYMGLLFFTNLATWLWLEAMDGYSWYRWIGYSVAVALGLWIHMTMLFVMAAHAGIFLSVWLFGNTRKTGSLFKAAVAFMLCGTLSLQVYALALPEFFHTAASEVSPPSEWTNPLWVVAETLRSLQVGFAGVIVVLCGGLLILCGWFDILRKQPRAAWAMILPAVMGGGSMLVLGHNLWPRFFFFCMGFGLLIVVHGAMQLPQFLMRPFRINNGWAARAGYLLAALIIVASISTLPRGYALPKQDFIGARDYVERQRTPGDVVLSAGLAVHAYADYYAPTWAVANNASDLMTTRPDKTHAFLVYTLPIELKAAHPDIWKAVQTDFETLKVFPGTLGGGEVYVCRQRDRTQTRGGER
jgi:mannosyltransferase